MPGQRVISVVGCHAEGEVGDVIVGGVLPPAGATMFDKMQTMQREHDHIRTVLLQEPRGSVAKHVNLLVPPTRDDCDAGVIIMEPTEYPPMSGSNTIATVTVLLETGIVPMTEPVSTVRLDMPGGRVVATAQCSDGRCRSVRIENVPSFAQFLDVELDVPGIGTVNVDIAYGGMYYALVDITRFGLRVAPAHARELVELADRIRVAARTQLKVVHPENPAIRDVTMVQFDEPFNGPGQRTANTCVLASGRHDRSPTGTGTSARMAVLHARGQLAVGEGMIHTSIIGTEFAGSIVAETRVSDLPAIVPSIEGRAWITGHHTYVIQADDPFPHGYLVPDMFGGTELMRGL